MQKKIFDAFAVVVVLALLAVLGVKLNAAWNGATEAQSQTRAKDGAFNDKLTAMKNGTYQPPAPPPVAEVKPASAPIPPKHTHWTLASTFKGDSDNPDTNTDTFNVGDRWKIEWTTDEGKFGPQGSLGAFIMSPPGAGRGDHNASASGAVITHSGKGSGENLQYWAGEYYLHIISNQRYVVQVYTQD
jgi:hypothetical protein